MTKGETRSWLIDMDGVLMREEQAIPGADQFIARLGLQDHIHCRPPYAKLSGRTFVYREGGIPHPSFLLEWKRQRHYTRREG